MVVDAITGLGVFEILQDDWGIDVLVSGSQKALMLPPGLAFAGVRDKAWEFNKTSTLPSSAQLGEGICQFAKESD